MRQTQIQVHVHKQQDEPITPFPIPPVDTTDVTEILDQIDEVTS